MRCYPLPVIRWATKWNTNIYHKYQHGLLLKPTRGTVCVKMTRYSSQAAKKTSYDIIDIQTEIKRLNGIENMASLHMKRLNNTKMEKLNILKIEYEILKAEGNQVIFVQN